MFGPKNPCILQKASYALAPTATMGVCQIQARWYEKNVVWAKGFVHFAKSHVLCGPNWTFDKVKTKGTRKMLLRPKGTCIFKKSRTLWPQLDV